MRQPWVPSPETSRESTRLIEELAQADEASDGSPARAVTPTPVGGAPEGESLSPVEVTADPAWQQEQQQRQQQLLRREQQEHQKHQSSSTAPPPPLLQVKSCSSPTKVMESAAAIARANQQSAESVAAGAACVHAPTTNGVAHGSARGTHPVLPVAVLPRRSHSDSRLSPSAVRLHHTEESGAAGEAQPLRSAGLFGVVRKGLRNVGSMLRKRLPSPKRQYSPARRRGR
jgi:hypothetical protein